MIPPQANPAPAAAAPSTAEPPSDLTAKPDMMSPRPPAAAAWTLCGQFSDEEPVRSFAIEASPFTVGRASDQNLPLPSQTVSGRHAELRVEGDGLIVVDLDSTNGTFVNGERIRGSSPLGYGDLVQFAQVVFRVGRDAPARHSATLADDSADRALSLIQFDKLMTERAVAPHFQPIMSMKSRQPIGYEVLGRSRLFGLTDPQSMFGAAAVLNQESELSRILREEGLVAGKALPGQHILFANTHPSEIDDPDLLEFSLRELREAMPTRPMVLEIHEKTATKTHSMRELRAKLLDLNIGLAYDDFGAGQARLVELVEVPPDYLKFDIGLVKNIHAASTERQKMVERLVQMTAELGIVPLAEGVETHEDHVVCDQLGFLCSQGFYYGRPAPVDTLLG